MSDTLPAFKDIMPEDDTTQQLQKMADEATKEPAFVTELAGPKTATPGEVSPTGNDTAHQVMDQAVPVAKAMTPEATPSQDDAQQAPEGEGRLPGEITVQPDALVEVQQPQEAAPDLGATTLETPATPGNTVQPPSDSIDGASV